MPASETSPYLSFRDLEKQNMSRARRLHKNFPFDTAPDGWSISDWSNAMCGEAGEAANIVKKMRRLDIGIPRDGATDRPELVHKLGLELADVIIYADLLATKCGIDLAEAIREKFNLVSEREGTPEKL